MFPNWDQYSALIIQFHHCSYPALCCYMIDVKTRVIDSPALTESIYSAYQLSRPLVAFIGPFSDKCRVDRGLWLQLCAYNSVLCLNGLYCWTKQQWVYLGKTSKKNNCRFGENCIIHLTPLPPYLKSEKQKNEILVCLRPPSPPAKSEKFGRF